MMLRWLCRSSDEISSVYFSMLLHEHNLRVARVRDSILCNCNVSRSRSRYVYDSENDVLFIRSKDTGELVKLGFVRGIGTKRSPKVYILEKIGCNNNSLPFELDRILIVNEVILRTTITVY